MTQSPSHLATLLHGSDAAERERAWERFVADYSRLLLHAIRRTSRDHDEVMDRFAYVLEQLRADDYRRLRIWGGDGRSKITTWLVIVTQRLCTDYERKRYGRAPDGVRSRDVRDVRRQLADLVAEELQDDIHGGEHARDLADAEHELRGAELRTALARALATLEPADQLLLTLRFTDGLSAASIARALAMATPFHVYRRLHHLLEKLRGELRSVGIEDSVP
jgi:RNA polymerase sigma factor (sigma-70 family)